MALSKIQWTDYTFNPWIGCRKVAPECANCYAETLDRNRYSKTLAPGTKENPVSHWGSGPRHRTKTWGDPVKWNKAAAGIHACPRCGWKARCNPAYPGHCFSCGEKAGVLLRPSRPRVFCASLADWLDDENVPIEWFADFLHLVYQTQNLDWLLLTKRPQNWQDRLGRALRPLSALSEGKHDFHPAHIMARKWLDGIAPANVWIGVSAGADQAAALDIPARVHFLSCEPMLRGFDYPTARDFDWIIFGGESGKNARPCNAGWIRHGVEFCREQEIAPFVKQLGSVPVVPAGRLRHHEWGEGKFEQWKDESSGLWRVKLKDSHGGDMDEWPEDLRVREFPEVPR